MGLEGGQRFNPLRQWSTQMEYSRCKQTQVELRDFVLNMNLPMFGTLVVNPADTTFTAEEKLKRFHRMLDMKILGRNLKKYEEQDRTFFIAFPEQFSSFPHYHLLIRPAKDFRLDKNQLACTRYYFFAPQIWKKICPEGCSKFSFLQHQVDKRKTTYYSLKRAWKENNFSNFVVSSEFF